LVAALMVSCSSRAPRTALGPSNGLRETNLKELGYQALPLKKITRDSRFSGNFLVNGRSVNLLIDSGANSTDLDTNLAPSLGLKIDENTRVISRGALGRPVTSEVGLGVLSAGPVTALPFPFMLATETTGPTATSRYDGQLGLDALEALGALIDLRTGSFWVPTRDAANSRDESIRPLGEKAGLGFNTLQLRQAGRLPHLVLESEWNGRLVTWIVDTGAEVSVLSKQSAKNLQLHTYPSAARIIDASGDNASTRGAIFRNMIFDRLILSEFQVVVTDLPVVRKNFKDSNGRAIDGIIGMDFLENSAALLDAGSRLLYVGDPQLLERPQKRVAQSAPRVTKPIGLQW